MPKYNLKSNAKLNLYINVNFKMSNNYHDLTMLNIPINLYDTLNIQILEDAKNETKVSVQNFDSLNQNLNDENNLVYHVVNHFKKIENKKFGFSCKIFKEIPTMSGTGGASSNASFVIKFLYNYFKIPILNSDLCLKYVCFGADIPYFFYNCNAIVNKTGENVKPINLNLKKYYFVLIHPNIKQSTKDVYLKLNSQSINPDDGKLELAIENICKNSDFKLLKNDFFNVVKNLKYDKIIEELYTKGAEYVNITGTGSSVFGIFKKEINAKNLNNELEKKYKNVYICQNIGDKNE